MRLYCPLCGPQVRHGDNESYCAIHVMPLEPYEPAGGTAGEAGGTAGEAGGPPGGTAGEADQPSAGTPGAAGGPTQERGGPAGTAAPAADGGSPTCWNCGTVPPHPDNVECVNPNCRRPLAPPALVIRFRDGQVELNRGERAELGRHGRYRPLFRSFRNVSRRHAVVGVEPDGHAWIEPGRTPNGTFLDEREIPDSVRRGLRSGQMVRLARHAEGIVTVYAADGGAR